MTGASGAPYFLRLLQRMRAKPGIELHLLISEGGKRVLQEECGLKWPPAEAEGLGVHANKNIGASVASGSFRLESMVIVPCSMNTASALAYGLAGNLIQRCAAVQLKESRPLIVVPRETPFSLPNLRALTLLKEAGAIIMPASPGFYHQPQSVQDLVDTVVDRILDHLGVTDEDIKRWNPP